jgi:hypothetical protein
MVNVNLHIERLVFESIDLQPAQLQLLQTAIETELTRQLSVGGISQTLISSGATPSLRPSEIQLSTPVNPRRLGGQIAGAVYSRLKV